MCWPLRVLCLSCQQDQHVVWFLGVRPVGSLPPSALSSLPTPSFSLAQPSVGPAGHGQCPLWAHSGPQTRSIPSLPAAVLSSTLCSFPCERVSLSCHACSCDGFFAPPPCPHNDPVAPKALVLCASDLQATASHFIQNTVFYGICDVGQLGVHHGFMCTKKKQC